MTHRTLACYNVGMTTTPATETNTFPSPDECYYCGTVRPVDPAYGCVHRNGELPCVPRRFFRGSTAVVRAAMAAAGLR